MCDQRWHVEDFWKFFGRHVGNMEGNFGIRGAARGGLGGLGPPSQKPNHPWASPPPWNDTLYRGLWRVTIVSPGQPPWACVGNMEGNFGIGCSQRGVRRTWAPLVRSPATLDLPPPPMKWHFVEGSMESHNCESWSAPLSTSCCPLILEKYDYTTVWNLEGKLYLFIYKNKNKGVGDLTCFPGSKHFPALHAYTVTEDLLKWWDLINQVCLEFSYLVLRQNSKKPFNEKYDKWRLLDVIYCPKKIVICGWKPRLFIN